MSTEVRGSCLCGEVRFAVEEPFDAFYVCYCSRCRKATGSAHASNLFVQAERFRWLAGEDRIQHHELAGARFFSRSFCGTCGAAVPRASKRDGKMVIPAGALDDEPAIRPQQQIYCADQAAWSKDLDSVPRSEQGRG